MLFETFFRCFSSESEWLSIILPQRCRTVEAIHFEFTPSADLKDFLMACEDKSLTPEWHTEFTWE